MALSPRFRDWIDAPFSPAAFVSYLQQQHKPDEAARYRERARPCPKCGRTSKDLAWFYFESPEWTWANLCGRAGWITVCDACHAQVDCFLESMS